MGYSSQSTKGLLEVDGMRYFVSTCSRYDDDDDGGGWPNNGTDNNKNNVDDNVRHNENLSTFYFADGNEINEIKKIYDETSLFTVIGWPAVCHLCKRMCMHVCMCVCRSLFLRFTRKLNYSYFAFNISLRDKKKLFENCFKYCLPVVVANFFDFFTHY